MNRTLLAAGMLALGGVSATPLGAQVSVAAARWLTDPRVTDYRLSFTRYWLGPVALVPYANVAVQGPKSAGAFLVGGGGEALLRLSSDARPYLVAGASAGFLDFRKSLGFSLWSAWSAGAGAELVRIDPVGIGAELRYQHLSRQATGGVSLGLRLGSAIGYRQERRSDPVSPNRPAARERAPIPAASSGASPSLGIAGRAAPAADVVNLARNAMGAPYRWGGSDQNGFDCSALIRYAYAQIGIDLPRQSRDQARSGREVPRSIDELAAGDLLTFSDTPGGDRVTHVGLYLGDGTFIHSASTGVRISALSDLDPDGRWWFARWVAARRIQRLTRP